MRKHYTILFLQLILVLTVFTSCKKDKEDEATPSTEQMLVADEWQGSAVMAMGLDVSARPEVREVFPDIKTLTLSFNNDGTYIATYRENNTPQTISGRWQLLNNGKVLSIDMIGDLEIKTITQNQLILATKVPLEGSAGVTVETEAHFVRP
ncbi:copper resistance protein NlpE [Pontibacter sp. SGAir0037]|uniref:copper resistance protein NlpE n=1 Tax=Pontibacter sp. SGAir0037 TaxID=2571030 RepID=UPI0010CCD423|nr:copper resistance protein NlpE [Pontibacter sp. SGAir0037]QCR22652.1 hypothetical protein C1N53_10065 [Pontibacter sp. SGAir0037]